MGSKENTLELLAHQERLPFLEECLGNILQQKYRSFEIIFANDCTPDRSMSIVAKLSAMEPRIKVVEHDVNRGLSTVHNTGLSIAAGKYVFFVDSDDIFPLNSLFDLVSAAECHNAQIVRGHRPRLFHKETGYRTVPARLDVNHFGQEVHGVNVVTYPKLVLSSNSLSSLYERHFLDQNRLPFSYELKQREDQAFYMQAFFSRSEYHCCRSKCHFIVSDHLGRGRLCRISGRKMCFISCGKLRSYTNSFSRIVCGMLRRILPLRCYSPLKDQEQLLSKRLLGIWT